MTEIVKAAEERQFKLIENLADKIWREHYTAIIGIDQVNFMLKKFQSFEAIQEQIHQGYLYFILKFERKETGYISIKKDKDALFLSKIYVLKSLRGHGIGKKAMEFIEQKALELNCSYIQLTVNKNNVDSIKAYEKMGFVKQEDIVIDIGNGFVMDDYRMTKSIS
ncbi:GNAT family N-acetyltransferase [Hyunsoonleella sp. SJ7]|uniref:GNAT family N-acetyltransferase n=1 Tax=Hyunsoonleella aquatilis TaxID=2762758 RepID=A0A923KMB3_9FLAO|nr:GNAT family N-acetyltransferase [Hyunsoonleella aquatilis]MBC3759608.1 GNAT family N-acetyltransferase [Hyunsoonleella aquatilis]